MTNGEKLVKVFPDIELYQKMHGGIQIDFDSVWWNAEYQEPTIKNNLEVDAVSRKAVLNTLDSMDSALDEDRTVETYKDLLKECYKVLPSVTPIRPKGHWIETAEEYYKAINEKGGGVNENTDYFVDNIACSECLAKFSIIDNEAERFDFCPCCGSDNK